MLHTHMIFVNSMPHVYVTPLYLWQVNINITMHVCWHLCVSYLSTTVMLLECQSSNPLSLLSPATVTIYRGLILFFPSSKSLAPSENTDLIFQVRKLLFWTQAVHCTYMWEKSIGDDPEKLPFIPWWPQSQCRHIWNWPKSLAPLGKYRSHLSSEEALLLDLSCPLHLYVRKKYWGWSEEVDFYTSMTSKSM